MTPKRIQRKRTRGWRMPGNTVYVGRPSKWGNPFPVGGFGPLGRSAIDPKGACGLFQDMLDDPEFRAACDYPDDLSGLKEKNLACWCPLDQPCHADILLKIVNGEENG